MKIELGQCVSWYSDDHPTIGDKLAMILNICEHVNADELYDSYGWENDEVPVAFNIIHEAVTQLIGIEIPTENKLGV